MREELGEAIRVNESLGAPSARAMKNLFAKIDAEPVAHADGVVQSRRLDDRLRRGFSPRTLAYGATAAALAIVLQAGLIAGVVVKERQGGAAARLLRQHGVDRHAARSS